MATATRLADLSDLERNELEALVLDFDRSWESGHLSARVQEALADSVYRLPALVEMIKVDLEREWAGGHRVLLESYLSEYPELGGADVVAPDLILAEFRVRCEFGDAPDLDEYARRFSRPVEDLRRWVAEVAASDLGDTVPWVQAVFGRGGRYRILRKLGKGGMGSVYLAEDSKLRRQVALKVSDCGSDAGALKRFEREAQALAALEHANICRVHDHDIQDGIPYMVMEYVPGGSLASALDERSLSSSEVVDLVITLARAMQDVHDRGILHRDLKPANIMRKATRSGWEPVIVDFGLAHRTEAGGSGLTAPGVAVGTLPYMPLEQINGEPEKLGPACDVYALGATLFELLTGRRPFSGSLATIVAEKASGEPPRASSLRPGIDPRLEAILRKALAREIAGRYRSMAAFAEALEDFRRTAPTEAIPNAATVVAGGDALSATIPPDPNATTSVVPATVPAVAPSPGPPDRRRPSGRAIALAACGFGALVLLGVIIIIVTTDRGTWTVELPAEPPKDGKILGTFAPAGPTRLKPEPEPEPRAEATVVRTPTARSLTDRLGMVLVRIEPGRFRMGSTDEQGVAILKQFPELLPDPFLRGFAAEQPQHEVRITRPFYLAAREVTVGQFRRFVESTGYRTEAETTRYPTNWRSPGVAPTDDHPVTHLAYRDVRALSDWMTRTEGTRSGLRYRLPTEAEWEYACRAGAPATALFPGGDDPEVLARVANVADGTMRRAYPKGTSSMPRTLIRAEDGFVFTAPVGSFAPNAWGLHDMIGNVSEWCEDIFDAEFYTKARPDDPFKKPSDPDSRETRAIRGGSFTDPLWNCRPSARSGRAWEFFGISLGVRLAADPAGDGP